MGNVVSREQIKVNLTDLKIGMYVCQLDRPWIETPFLLQGLLIKAGRDIAALQRHCDFVYVDITKSASKVIKQHFVHVAKNKVSKLHPDKTSASPANKKSPAKESKFKKAAYAISLTVEKELPQADIAFQDLSQAMQSVFNNVRNNQSIDVQATKQAAKEMVGSIIRNPDAFVWLARVKEKDSYSYEHSIRSAILAIVFGRHLGLPPAPLQNLAMGVLLSEVGMAKIPDEILKKKGKLTDEEFEIVKKHVEYSAEILSTTPGVSDQVLQVVWSHHERHDGSGYPRQLRGQQIHPLGKIAGIVDCYDAMTSPRSHAKPKTASDAVAMLYKMRNKDFQSELVEQFIQAIGLYPTGTLVQLSTDEVGIIISQNKDRRLCPKVMVVLDENKIPIYPSKIIDLIHYQKNTAEQAKISISLDLKAGAFDIYPQDIMVMSESSAM
ncbi:MAG: metal-dependent phosphohydrolase [Gammaproteobacteria bacterium]|nr:MAG: metal-dependent phosphohydrolase [Gammaproteobacteria bacterium]